MMRRAHWGWVLLLMLVGAAAVVVNASSRRVFILHEGRANQAASQAFFAAAESVLRASSQVKARHQYLGGVLDGCSRALAQIAAFSADALIAEGLQARHCIARRVPATVQTVIEPATHIGGQGHADFVAAWAGVLEDLASHTGPVTVLHGEDAEGRAESQRLIEAAALAGREIQTLAFSADSELPIALAATDNMIVVGRTVGDGAAAGKDGALRALFDALHAATPQTIMATRLDSVFLGADMALDQAPEQRGEQMALAALHGGSSTDAEAVPLEMAVALRGEFAYRMGAALPAFYLASARLSGFLATPENRTRAVPRVQPARTATTVR
ncbi:MAG: hypothetical protein ABWY08_04505 [Comamonas sp.]